MSTPGPWPPSSEAQLALAARNGLLTESHTLDLKRELSRSDSANRDIAKDIAAFSLDGGAIIIGVDEETSPPSLYPVPLDGLAERIEQIAASRVDEAAMITTTAIDSATEPGKGYLVVHVPASPRAPLMADGKYYGRGDKRNRVLPHIEVLRLHERQLGTRRDIIQEATERLNKLLEEHPDESREMMLLIARPLGGRDDLLEGLSDSQEWPSTLLQWVRTAAIPERQQFSPSLREASSTTRAPNGIAASVGMWRGRWSGTGSAAEIVFEEDGTLVLTSNRTVLEDRNQNPHVFDALIVGHTDLVARLCPHVADYCGFTGSWQFAVLARGLRGAPSYAASERSFGDYGARYGTDSYERAATATLEELKRSPENLVRGLLGRLLRSLNSPPWLLD
jgi:hypothetical protein